MVMRMNVMMGVLVLYKEEILYLTHFHFWPMVYPLPNVTQQEDPHTNDHPELFGYNLQNSEK